MPKPRILLVDDETDILAELVPFLEREGYVVETATGNSSCTFKDVWVWGPNS